ncbi:Insulin receptor [Nymphon striatum]|nr:Insulin receptor [Nymphon striatum]
MYLISVCDGMNVDNVATAQKLDGCTAISGSLTIQLNGQGGSIYQELEKFLGRIESIDGYLKIMHSASLISLNFFRNLTVIKGNKLDRDFYSLVVRDNENLQELWDLPQRKNKLKIRNGRPFFHYNPQLCMKKINDTMQNVGIKDLSHIEISPTSNGNKGACTKKNMDLDTFKVNSFTVTILFDNFRKIHYDARTILSYVISYREVTSNQQISLFDGRDACGDGNWKVVDYDASNASDKDDKVQYTLSDLIPDTKYAVHVRTSVIDSEPLSGFSKIITFTTKPNYPTSPLDLTSSHITENGLELEWIPPLKPNGKVTHYAISWVQEREDADEVWQQNFCEDLSISFKSKQTDQIEIKDPSFSNKTTPNNNTCSCTNSKKVLEADIKEQIYFENFLQNAAYKKKTLKNPRSKRSFDKVNFSIDVVSTPDPQVSTETVFISSTPSLHSDYKLTNKPPFSLKNLHHFTKYHIKVIACHDLDHSTNISRCSHPSVIYPRTKPKPTADDIVLKKVSSKVDNHTSGLVHIRWKPPLEPNGIIGGYQVEYKRVDIQNYKPITVCITKKKYKKKQGHSLQGLQPGKYSMRLQAISLAGKGSWTDYTYFEIREPENGLKTSTIVAIICMSVFFFIVIVAVIIWRGFKRRYQKRFESANLMTSVNPEYCEYRLLSFKMVISEYIPDEWEVNRDKVEFICPLGQGTFGMVHEGIAEDPKTGLKFRCAIKTVNEKSSSREFLKEATVMKGFTCHHVVRLKGIVSVTAPTLVIMELMENGDLKNFLRSQREDYVQDQTKPQHPPRASPKPNQFVQMAAEIADGMDYLSSQKFVHRDLAARNCMVAKDFTVKIGDFGMTRDIYETDYYRKGGKGMLPVRWMAPESLKDGVYTSHSDVWSYGIVLWEMVTLACQPYPGLSNEEVFNYIVNGGVMEKPLDCDEKLYNIMMSCWQINPLLRPSFNELVKCFLSGVDKNFKTRSFHFGCSSASDSDDSDDAELIGPSSPLRSSSQNKDATKKNIFNKLLNRYHKSKKHKSPLPRVNSKQESLSDNHNPAPENHRPSDVMSVAIAGKNSNNSTNGFVPSENTASTCC